MIGLTCCSFRITGLQTAPLLLAPILPPSLSSLLPADTKFKEAAVKPGDKVVDVLGVGRAGDTHRLAARAISSTYFMRR